MKTTASSPERATPPATVLAGGALARGIARLEAASVPSAALAAELLLLHLLGRDRTWLYAHPEHPLSPEELARYDEMLTRRAEGVPVQYLTGRQEFWGLEFEVNPSVLIPRPETEHLIEVALERLGQRRNAPLCVADVGTGSGCIAVALARELPQARIVATDISPWALQVARRNAARHGVGERIRLLRMNLLESYLTTGDATEPLLDLIVSNPPYVGRGGCEALPREVLEHEPHEALFAGEHGLDVYPQLIAQAAGLLRPGGVLVVELGYGLSERVGALAAAQPGWTNVSITNDLAGIPRVLAAERISA
jgi:release factor glutamine methyltransferase